MLTIVVTWSQTNVVLLLTVTCQLLLVTCRRRGLIIRAVCDKGLGQKKQTNKQAHSHRGVGFLTLTSPQLLTWAAAATAGGPSPWGCSVSFIPAPFGSCTRGTTSHSSVFPVFRKNKNHRKLWLELRWKPRDRTVQSETWLQTWRGTKTKGSSAEIVSCVLNAAVGLLAWRFLHLRALSKIASHAD